jgi:ribonuclease P protein component
MGRRTRQPGSFAVSQRYPPSVRLRSRREYSPVQERGRRVSTKLLTVLALPNAGPSDRLGIIASRKFGNAVVRNRAKRRLREVFRRREPDQPSTGSRTLDIVVIPRRESIVAVLPAIAADFEAAVQRLRGMK